MYPVSQLTDGPCDTADRYQPRVLLYLRGQEAYDVPCRATCGGRALLALQQAAGATLLSPLGITFQEFLNTDAESDEKSFIIALDLEKVSHAAFTGEDFGGGRQFFT